MTLKWKHYDMVETWRKMLHPTGSNVWSHCFLINKDWWEDCLLISITLKSVGSVESYKVRSSPSDCTMCVYQCKCYFFLLISSILFLPSGRTVFKSLQGGKRSKTLITLRLSHLSHISWMFKHNNTVLEHIGSIGATLSHYNRDIEGKSFCTATWTMNSVKG